MSSKWARRAFLAARIARHGGEWTTRRVMDLYREQCIAPCRKTARDDLAAVARTGLLDLDDQPNRRSYQARTGVAR